MENAAASKGGARSNAGRPAGKPNKKTIVIRNLSDESIFNGGALPLEVMLDNMRYFYREANETLAEMLKHEGPVTEKVLQELKEITSFRKAAQECAVDAAPFIHPRLANVSHSGDKDNPVQVEHKNAAEEFTRRVINLFERREEDEAPSGPN